MKDGVSLNPIRCLVESINIIMFLVFEIAGNRNRSSFNANITSAFILVENDCFGIFNATSDDSRFGFLEIVFRNWSQFLRATTATTEARENTVFGL